MDDLNRAGGTWEGPFMLALWTLPLTGPYRPFYPATFSSDRDGVGGVRTNGVAAVVVRVSVVSPVVAVSAGPVPRVHVLPAR